MPHLYTWISLLLVVLIFHGTLITGDDDIEEQADYIQAVDGIQFEVVTLFDQPKIMERVWDMEEDVFQDDSYLFADGSSLKRFDLTTRKVSSLIEASPSEFIQITGFTQTNDTHILLVDSLRHCLKWFDRDSHSVTVAAGRCGSSGLRNGNLLESQFNTPFKVVAHPRFDSVFVTDSLNNALRIVSLAGVTTFVSLADSPYGITITKRSEELYVTTATRLIKVNVRSKAVTPIIPSLNLGFQDGSTRRAKISRPLDVIQLNRNTMLIADSGNNRLRVVNLRSLTVSSICTSSDDVGSTGTRINSCKLNSPLSLMKYQAGTLAIGGNSTTMKLLTYIQEDRRPPTNGPYGYGGRPGGGRPGGGGLDGDRPDGSIPDGGRPDGNKTDGVKPTRPRQESDESEEGKRSGGKVGGKQMQSTTVIAVSVATGGVVLTVIIIALACLLYKRSKRSRDNGPTANLDLAVRNNSIHKQHQDHQTGAKATGAFSNPYDEYAEVEDPYQTLETKATDGYTLLETDAVKGTPLAKKSTRYGPLPHRPTSESAEDKQTPGESTEKKSEDDYYYASTEDMTEDEDEEGERRPTVSKRLNVVVGRQRSANDYGYVDFEEDKVPEEDVESV